MMSEEKEEKQEKAPPKKKEKVRRKSRLAKWFREMRSELRKVVWPTPKQVVNNTVIALVIMAISAVVVYGIDTVGGQIVRALLTLGGK